MTSEKNSLQYGPHIPCVKSHALRPENGSSALTHFSHHIFPTIRVRNVNGAFRIISPFTIHDELVGMSTRSQGQRSAPSSVGALPQRDRACLPMSEISGQQHAHGVCCGEVKRFLVWVEFFASHTAILSSGHLKLRVS